MSVKTVRRIASRIFNCGESRVVIVDFKKASEALSADDVRELAKTGAVRIMPVAGVGRGKARLRSARRHAGRGRGVGSRRGSPNAILESKKRWMLRVRFLRSTLRFSSHLLSSAERSRLYRMIKGNAFASRKQLAKQIAQSISKGRS